MAGWLLAFALFPLLSADLPAQEPPESPIDTIISLALESPELSALAAGLVDSIGGRLSGTASGQRAEGWASSTLEQIGFDSVWTEPVPMRVWRRGSLSIRVLEPASRSAREIDALAYGYSSPVSVAAARLVDIGRGEPAALDALGGAARGAAVLADVLSPELLERAHALGVAAVMRISFEPGRLPQARVSPVGPGSGPAVIALSNEDGSWLRRMGQRGQVLLRLTSTSSITTGAAANVIGDLRGGDPGVADEMVVLGAHLDAWDVGDGALDNGTGVLMVLSAVRAIVASGQRPRRTIRVVLFAGEELGLLGSRAYIARHRSELADVIAMLNADMVGEPQGFGATGHPEADTLFDRLIHDHRLRELRLSSDVDHGGGPGSDHQPFLLAGVPTVYVRTSLPPDAIRWYHNAGDTLDKVDMAAVRHASAAAAALAWALADAPGRPFVHLDQEQTQALIERLGWVGPNGN